MCNVPQYVENMYTNAYTCVKNMQINYNCVGHVGDAETCICSLIIFEKQMQSVESTEIGPTLYDSIAFFCKVHIVYENVRNASCLSSRQ